MTDMLWLERVWERVNVMVGKGFVPKLQTPGSDVYIGSHQSFNVCAQHGIWKYRCHSHAMAKLALEEPHKAGKGLLRAPRPLRGSIKGRIKSLRRYLRAQ